MQVTDFGHQVFTEIRALLKHASAVARLSQPTGLSRDEITLAIYEALTP